jgi:hypothetical protein
LTTVTPNFFRARATRASTHEFTTSRKPLGDLVVPKRKTRRSGDHEGQAANDRVRSAVRSDAHPTPEKGGISMAKKAAKKTAKKAAKKR